MSTYYIKLKSCSNAACEIKTLESLELPSSFDVRVVAEAWGAGNGSKAVEVSVENYAGDIVVSPHAVTVYRPVVAPAQKPLRDVLSLDSAVKFHAVLEALQQYIDNGRDAEELHGSEELQAKLEAAEDLRDQLDATLASLAG